MGLFLVSFAAGASLATFSGFRRARAFRTDTRIVVLRSGFRLHTKYFVNKIYSYQCARDNVLLSASPLPLLPRGTSQPMPAQKCDALLSIRANPFSYRAIYAGRVVAVTHMQI